MSKERLDAAKERLDVAKDALLEAAELVKVPSNIGLLSGSWVPVIGGIVDTLDGLSGLLDTFGLEPDEWIGPPPIVKGSGQDDH